MRAVLLALLLAGCAAAQPKDSDPLQVEKLTYPNYHELVRSATLAEMGGNVPADVAGNYAQCWADAKVGRLAPDELAEMDQVARAEKVMTVGELRQKDEAIYQTAGTHDRWAFMTPYCPGLIDRFKRYE